MSESINPVLRGTVFEPLQTWPAVTPAQAHLRPFYAGEPDWSMLALAGDVAARPAVRRKLLNLERLNSSRPKSDRQPASLDKAFAA